MNGGDAEAAPHEENGDAEADEELNDVAGDAAGDEE